MSSIAFIQKKTLPGVWSKAVQIAKVVGTVELVQKKQNLSVFRVQTPGRPVAQEVEISFEDEDYSCDCTEKTDPCTHVAAAAIFHQNYKHIAETLAPAAGGPSSLEYHFFRTPGGLGLKGLGLKRKFKDQWIEKTLTALTHLPMRPTQDDYAIDRILQKAQALHVVLRHLAGTTSPCFLEGAAIQTRPDLKSEKLTVQSERGGYRVQLRDPEFAEEFFENGIIRQGSVLQPGRWFTFSETDRRILGGIGKLYPADRAGDLMQRMIPQWRQMGDVEILSESLLSSAQDRHIEPVLNLSGTVDGRLEVRLCLEGNPDPTERKQLETELRQKYSLSLDQTVFLEKNDAYEFLRRSFPFKTIRANLESFEQRDELTPDFQVTEAGGKLSFKSGGDSVSGETVITAYRTGNSAVPLFRNGKQLGFAPLPIEWLSQFADKIESLQDLKAPPEVAAIQALKVFDADAVHFSEGLSELKDALFATAVQSSQNEPCPTLNANLRDYQKRGVAWMNRKLAAGLGVCLADDMGLGKTLQAIATLTPNSLIVAPSSLQFQWKSELEKFRPDFPLLTYPTADRNLPLAIPGAVLTTYGFLRQEIARFSEREFDTIILDESHTIKNADSQTAQAIFQLKGRRRVALTGTPVENRLSDLRSQFRFLNPLLFNSESTIPQFRPFILRRMKTEVAKELPPKTESTLTVELSAEERKVYDSLEALTRAEVLKSIDRKEGLFQTLESLLRLREAASDWGLLPTHQGAPTSSKVTLLIEQLRTAVDSGHAILVFSQWTRLLDRVSESLKAADLPALRIDGSTPDRGRIVHEFQKDDGPPILLLSLKAGGVGLNLTRADQVFLLDPWWNPQIENQATDRAHRIGQTRAVNVYRMVAENTIEEKVLRLQSAKKAISDQLLAGTDASDQVTFEDLKFIFNG